MDKFTGQDNTEKLLFPPREPFAKHFLDVGDGHTIYVEQCGNPDGIPVIILHGGPGGGSSPAMRRFFDPARYHFILFDQRGCGRSKPHARIENNTTWHLVDDIERIRAFLTIDRWIVFGGSWGATLALIYAQEHPDVVRHLVLRGVFLATQAELDWFYGGGAGKFFPELWSRFTAAIPEEEHGNLIAAYNKRLFTGNQTQDIRYARIWAGWENALATIRTTGQASSAPSQYALAFARLENHFFMNRAFLDHDGYILRNMDKIAHIPGDIVHGRYDMVCPPASAQALADHWPAARLQMIPMAGHALSEPGIGLALLRVMNRLAQSSSD